MRITTVGFLSNIKRAELEKRLSSSGIVDDFDIENLDAADGMKDVMVVFKEPVDARFLGDELKELLGGLEKNIAAEDEE